VTYARDPYDTDQPPCVCGAQAPGPVLTTAEFCPACGESDKPAPEPPRTDFGAVLDEFFDHLERDDAGGEPGHVTTYDGLCLLAETGWPEEGSRP
jgi:hypothetical protein